MEAIDFEFYEEDILKADGFDSAVIGIAYRCAQQPILAYDYDKCVEILVERDGMSREGAIEYMEFNVVGAYMGEGTPCFVHPGFMEELDDG